MNEPFWWSDWGWLWVAIWASMTNQDRDLKLWIWSRTSACRV